MSSAVDLPSGALLSVVTGGAEPDEDDLVLFVRAVRRDMVRLLRALQAIGRGTSALPDPVTTRLAHTDAVTARFLLGATSDRGEVRAAANSMRAVERWIVERLSNAEASALRSYAIGVRVEEDELTQPVVRADWTGNDLEVGVSSATIERGEGRSVRVGLARLGNVELVHVCRRLGISVDPELASLRHKQLDARGFDPARISSERAVLRTLLDGHLLAILIATLPGEVHRLLAAIVRGQLDEASLRRLASDAPWEVGALAQAACGHPFGVEVQTPAQALRGCALAFSAGPGGCLWVPVEILRRIDGVLRAFGV